MRGGDEQTGELFSYVNLEKRVRSDHPLRAIRGLVNEALVALEQEFAALNAPIGRPSIAPEKLLRVMLLQAFYYSLGAAIDGAAGVRSAIPLVRGHRRRRRGVGSLSFSKNRERLLEGDIAVKLLSAVLAHRRVKRLLSTDHFSVDGTLIEAWASMKSFKPKDGSDEPRTEMDGTDRHHLATCALVISAANRHSSSTACYVPRSRAPLRF
jgi:transposase